METQALRAVWPACPAPFTSDMTDQSPNPDSPPGASLTSAAPNLSRELARYLSQHRTVVEDVVRRAGDDAGLAAGKLRARAFDGMLSTLFLAARSRMRAVPAGFLASLSAVGSYGRNAVALHSDIDIRILFEGDRADAQALAEAVLYPLWDIRVALGHQVVSLDDLIALAREDLRTATTLLDWRQIAGDAILAQELARSVFDPVFSEAGVPAFAEMLERDTVDRHDRFGATVYRLEPEIKLGAGGMRDLDVALWAARARWKVQRLEDLVRVGVLVPRDIADIVAAREHLWRVRNQLHLAAGRRSDRLSFDEQERIAPILGFGEGRVGAEALMSAHYQHARAVMHAREVVVGRAMARPRSRRPPETDLGGGLKLFDNHIVFASSAAIVGDPPLALRAYEQAVRFDVPVHESSRETLRRALTLPSFRAALQRSPQARSSFLALCCCVRETKLRKDSVIGDMHDVGLLTALIPEFEPVVGRVHHDVYHVLTVDVHSIAAVDRLRTLARGSSPSDSPLLCRLAAEMTRPHVLFLAVLLHDVGKAIGGTDHSSRGAPIAFDVARRLGLSAEDAADVSHLVRHHLALYHAATRRDLEDPAVIDDIQRVVRGPEGLRELYLLTWVDVATTAPDAMTAWKAAMLEELFHAVDGHFVGRHGHASDGAGARRSRIASIVSALGPSDQARAFLDSMPERYALTTTVERIRSHARIVASRPAGQLAVEVFDASQAASAELCVVADDKPGLLASIAACLAANRLSVLQAQIFSRARDDGGAEAIDLFIVRAPGQGTVADVRRAAVKMELDLRAVLLGRLAADEVVASRMASQLSERHTPDVETRVVVDNRASSRLSVVEVFTRDRPGLLCVLARTFRDLGLSIELAKINTEGTRVADVFYVCEPDGSKVRSDARADQIRESISRALEIHSPRRS